MKKMSEERTWSRPTKEALSLLAVLIKTARLENKMTVQEVAERAGISRSLLQRIEKGDPGCGVGVTFEVATVVGINLFSADEGPRTQALVRKHTEDKLRLLPKRTRHVKKKGEVFDDF